LIKKISKKDKEDWLKFIKGKNKIDNKDLESALDNKRYLVRSIDLHGYNLENANEKIKKFIEKSYFDGIDKIKVITGKGSRSDTENNPYVSKNLSILKYSIPEYINSELEIMSKIKKIDLEEINDPSKGSFVILLKKLKIRE